MTTTTTEPIDDVRVFDLGEVGVRLTLCERSVRDLIRGGELKAVRLGRRIVVRARDLAEFLATRPLSD